MPGSPCERFPRKVRVRKQKVPPKLGYEPTPPAPDAAPTPPPDAAPAPDTDAEKGGEEA